MGFVTLGRDVLIPARLPLLAQLGEAMADSFQADAEAFAIGTLFHPPLLFDGVVHQPSPRRLPDPCQRFTMAARG
ncbi:hypothetical protein A6A40_23385 (plasmid) [Azospirillum humicireducens]|uniref:Uncharacterized protein n=1 Tax=Azospirillum humicireducens TaxID=1226968 RepID=A0A2R4VU77_9PROT|nr:hypothetical protein A6A40_23385 [Azospirillum humicireducens]